MVSYLTDGAVNYMIPSNSYIPSKGLFLNTT